MNWLIQPETVAGVLVAAELLWLSASLVLVGRWAVTTRLGWRTLLARPARPNFLQLPTVVLVFLGFLLIAAALGSVAAGFGLIGKIDPSSTPIGARIRVNRWQLGVGIASHVAVAGLILLVASSAFAGGLRGFGLRGAGILRNILTGLAYLFAVFPIVMLVLKGTEVLFRRLKWPVTEHELFNLIKATWDPLLIALAIVTAVLAAPLVEEFFFRGILQSFMVRFFRVMMPPKGWPTMAFWLRPPELLRAQAQAALARARELGEQPPIDLDAPAAPEEAGGQAEPLTPEQEAGRAVAAILVASAVFAAAHYGMPTSIPAIFVLALALGYAYEKTGSLIATMTMHLAFNALNMVLFFLQAHLGR